MSVFDECGVFDVKDEYCARMLDASFRHIWRMSQADDYIAALASRVPRGALGSAGGGSAADGERKLRRCFPAKKDMEVSQTRPGIIIPPANALAAVASCVEAIRLSYSPKINCRKIAKLAFTALHNQLAEMYGCSPTGTAADAAADAPGESHGGEAGAPGGATADDQGGGGGADAGAPAPAADDGQGGGGGADAVASAGGAADGQGGGVGRDAGAPARAATDGQGGGGGADAGASTGAAAVGQGGGVGSDASAPARAATDGQGWGGGGDTGARAGAAADGQGGGGRGDAGA